MKQAVFIGVQYSGKQIDALWDKNDLGFFGYVEYSVRGHDDRNRSMSLKTHAAERKRRTWGMKKIGIIICNRYHTCAGGKCLRAMRNREGAFSLYKGEEIELVGFTTCGGCPGGNVEYAPAEMKKNGADVVHLATGMVVGYPPCPRLEAFCRFIPAKFGLDVVVGTHPIPQNYYLTHQILDTWQSDLWQDRIEQVLASEEVRLNYD